ncbi:glutamine--fructose-6-phosphate transaminase (isomerizing) [Iocasia frigidifontis]|uniref:Glutamine--fructose-6-phosphate aminotransferase [isomerizing] n=1 Tax=Iocasia fonsfrigidae TaxID=2682810 RepID=A0A8A7KCT6_9FIRM|nr:glutamine--fructose-6-phosphate transaminase (isomerizing) [Iocasia fonsfrigidae]QTL99251.1 glutamine--fructose-6-phosphate transaminase (isomerizing) [Iocasia fonsfrigidae]
MCGIVGYIGNSDVVDILLGGLKRLEYRGYDSAGIAINNGKELELIKKKGKLKELQEIVASTPLSGKMGIGHTRWATHGSPSDENSHPHVDCTGEFVVVHNGIIENFQQLREELCEKGHVFTSETDTEVIAHLLEEYYQGDLREAINQVIAHLEGSYALGIISSKETDKIYAVRQDSPLVIGIGEGENYIASDIPAFLEYTDQFYILDDGEMAEIKKDKITIYDQKGVMADKEVFEVNWDAEMAEKGGYPHFMLKEIYEQPAALRRVMADRVSPGKIELEEINLSTEEIKDFNKIYILACGTAYYSGMIGKYVIEELTRTTVEIDVASEFRYRDPIVDDKTLVIVVSQSGETADTLAGLRLAQQKGARVLALTNVVGSTIPREADEVFYLHAGPEIAVASTKAFTNMVAAFYLLALYIAKIKDTVSREELAVYIDELLKLPKLAAETLESSEEMIKGRARDYHLQRDAFFIGRNTDYTLSLEGALKLKEISYIHAEAYPAGELKHGPLALIIEGVPVIAIATRMSLYEKTLSNIKEVKARGADVTAITFRGEKEVEKSVDHVLYIPKINELFSGVLAIIPLQLLAYYTAVEKGYDVDQPRNLAKSVTVE